MLMVANSNCPIHGRLWCCLEAFCAVSFDVPVEIGGDPFWLVTPAERPRARAALDQAVHAQRAALNASKDGVRGDRPLKEALQQLHSSFEAIAIRVDDAMCSRSSDRRLILELIGDRAPAVNGMIKQQMVGACNEVMGNMLYSSAPDDLGSHVSVSSTTLEVPGRRETDANMNALTCILPGFVPAERSK